MVAKITMYQHPLLVDNVKISYATTQRVWYIPILVLGIVVEERLVSS